MSLTHQEIKLMSLKPTQTIGILVQKMKRKGKWQIPMSYRQAQLLQFAQPIWLANPQRLEPLIDRYNTVCITVCVHKLEKRVCRRKAHLQHTLQDVHFLSEEYVPYFQFFS